MRLDNRTHGEPSLPLSPKSGHFPSLALGFPTCTGRGWGYMLALTELGSIHDHNSWEERGHRPMGKCWWTLSEGWWWGVMAAVPAGCITKAWPERKFHAGKMNPGTEGSLRHLSTWAGASRECRCDRTLGSFKIRWIPFPSSWTHSSFSPFTFLNAHLP